MTSRIASFFQTPPRLVRQFLRFGVAGAVCFIIDYGLFLILFRLFDIYYILAATVSFGLSILLNWAINAHWVFDGSKISRKSVELIMFITIAAIGAGINLAVLWAGVEVFAIRAEISKLVASAAVALWNFSLRKRFLYH